MRVAQFCAAIIHSPTPTHMADAAKKPFYQSKIFLLGATLVLVFGGNFLFGFLSANITPDQLESVQDAEPAVLDIIQRLKDGESILSVIGMIIGVLISIFRAWFTTNSRLSF